MSSNIIIRGLEIPQTTSLETDYIIGDSVESVDFLYDPYGYIETLRRLIEIYNRHAWSVGLGTIASYYEMACKAHEEVFLRYMTEVSSVDHPCEYMSIGLSLVRGLANCVNLPVIRRS